MILDKVQKKKLWSYSYDSIEEMEIHLRQMTQAGFLIEKQNKEGLTSVLSQTFCEQKYEDIIFEKEDEKIEASLIKNGRK